MGCAGSKKEDDKSLTETTSGAVSDIKSEPAPAPAPAAAPAADEKDAAFEAAKAAKAKVASDEMAAIRAKMAAMGTEKKEKVQFKAGDKSTYASKEKRGVSQMEKDEIDNRMSEGFKPATPPPMLRKKTSKSASFMASGKNLLGSTKSALTRQKSSIGKLAEMGKKSSKKLLRGLSGKSMGEPKNAMERGALAAKKKMAKERAEKEEDERKAKIAAANAEMGITASESVVEGPPSPPKDPERMTAQERGAAAAKAKIAKEKAAAPPLSKKSSSGKSGRFFLSGKNLLGKSGKNLLKKSSSSSGSGKKVSLPA